MIIGGDGADEWNWMFWPQRGEYANTTYFLTDTDAIERLEVDEFPGKLSDVALPLVTQTRHLFRTGPRWTRCLRRTD